ncbi:hypothetical protein DVS28_a1541 [Euzebya pacifica]|uniref:Uncharacterized protein n=1 Tax=Euzebya pacifica TaxID=1608957 RepID=A0A346XVI7_9ACTN|nr:hypothetical protein DVS28_a1541 [Euzebya pacifica]
MRLQVGPHRALGLLGQGHLFDEEWGWRSTGGSPGRSWERLLGSVLATRWVSTVHRGDRCTSR